MFLLDWYKELLDIRRENERQRIELHKEETCESCEHLKLLLEKQQLLNQDLINKLTEKSVPEPVPAQVPVDIKPRHIPWNVKRQILEADDRKAAALQRQAAEQLKVNITPKGVVVTETEVAPPDDPDVLALEREMDLIASEREAKRG